MLTVILSERSESKDLGGWESVRKTPARILRLGRFAPSLRMTEWVALVPQASRLHSLIRSTHETPIADQQRS